MTGKSTSCTISHTRMRGVIVPLERVYVSVIVIIIMYVAN